MLFIGVFKEFSLKEEEQYNIIGLFWDEMSMLHGLEKLQGLGYKWEDEKIFYAIGLKNGLIDNSNFKLELPDNGWIVVKGKTDDFKKFYDRIYIEGPIKYEIQILTEEGNCQIKYYR